MLPSGVEPSEFFAELKKAFNSGKIARDAEERKRRFIKAVPAENQEYRAGIITLCPTPLPEGLLTTGEPQHGDYGIVQHGIYKGKPVMIRTYEDNTPMEARELLSRESEAYNGPLVPLWRKHVLAVEFRGVTSVGWMLVLSHLEGCQHPSPDSPPGTLELAVEGLKAIHECGLCHGDIVSSNILVQSDRVWFINFGDSYDHPSTNERHSEMADLYAIFGQTYPGDFSPVHVEINGVRVKKWRRLIATR